MSWRQAHEHSEPEPDLGPTKEEIERGLPPADMLSPHAESEIPEPPAWADELDTAYGAAQARRQLAEALAAAREPEPEIEIA